MAIRCKGEISSSKYLNCKNGTFPCKNELKCSWPQMSVAQIPGLYVHDCDIQCLIAVQTYIIPTRSDGLTVVNCNTPPQPANGRVTYSATTYNSVATYSCNGGYEFSGGSVTIQRSCLANGAWSGSTPSCMNGGECTSYLWPALLFCILKYN